MHSMTNSFNKDKIDENGSNKEDNSDNNEEIKNKAHLSIKLVVHKTITQDLIAS
jgi:hypothetical protein